MTLRKQAGDEQSDVVPAIGNRPSDRLILLYEHAPIGYMTLTKFGLIVSCNATLARMLKSTREALQKRIFSYLLAPESQSDYYRFREALWQNPMQEQRCEVVFLLSDHTRVVVELTSIQQQDDAASKGEVDIAITDVTKLRSAEFKLSRQGVQQEVIGRLSHKALVVNSAEMLFEETVACVAQILETRYVALIKVDSEKGLKCVAQNGWHAADVLSRDVWTHAAQIVSTGTMLRIDDFVSEDKVASAAGAQTRLRTVVAVPIMISDMITFVLLAYHTKPSIFDSNSEQFVDSIGNIIVGALERMANSTPDIKGDRSELKLQVKELDAFAHSVAHDLINPINAIIAYAEMLQTSEAAEADSEVGVHASAIERIGSQMNGIVESMLLLATVRRQSVPITKIDMTAIVDNVQLRLRHLLESADAKITCPPTWPDTVGYGPWLEEVWSNLVSNAVRYGGRPPHIELGVTEQQDGYVRFWVKDNGVGLSEYDRSYIFTNSQMHPSSKGYGLGLSIVQRIIAKLGGEVGVEESNNVGSIFYFTLPAAPLQ